MPSSLPLVSCIVPVHNGAEFLADALGSIVEQDYPAIEVIVIDDGSVDDSVEVAQSFEQVRLFQHANCGNAAARNRGIDVAQGEYLAFLDQDDLWARDKISCQVEAMQANPELLYCYGMTEFFLQQQPSPAWFQDKLLEGSHAGFGPGVLLAHRLAFERLGRFDENLNTTSDVEWFVQATEQAAPCKMLPQVMLRKRVHDAAQSSKTRMYHPELLKVLRRSIARRRESL